MKARTCSVHTVLVLVGLAQLVTVRPPVSALVLADALFAHALYAISFTRCFCCFLLVSL